MPRFLHAADIHLDSNPPRGLEPYEGAPVEAVRGATRRALANLVDLAIDRRVDAVLVAGDLYDGDWKDAHTGLFFVSQVRRLRDAGIATYIIRGNHDAASQLTRSLPLPDNPDGSRIVLSHEQPETVVLEDLGLAIHGRGFARRAETDNLARRYPAPIRGMFNIGMLHTCLTGGEGHEPYAPCTPDELKSKGYDYWALGHIHIRTAWPPGPDADGVDGPPILFSGNVQGRHARETGAKGCYLVEVRGEGRAEIEFCPTDVYRWESVEVDARGAADVDELEERVAKRLGALCRRQPDVPMAVRMRLTGATDLHHRLAARPATLIDRMRAVGIDAGGGRVWIEQLRLRTSPAGEAGDGVAAWADDGPLAELDALIDELGEDAEALADLGRSLGDLRRKLPADLGEDDLPRPDDPAWVAETLAEVRGLLLGRLAESGAEDCP